MKVIYVSALISKKKMNYIIDNSKSKPLQSIQRYHRLICEGLVENNCNVKTISAIPVSRKISNKRIWFCKAEIENDVNYQYIPFINLPIIRQLFLLLFTLLMVIKEIVCSKDEILFICDVLNTTVSSITLFICKLFGIKCTAVVTDLPSDMKESSSISIKINNFIKNYYDYYILISEKMNDVLNKKNKPYIVIEGICEPLKEMKSDKIKEKYIMYAGGLYEKYGLKYLIDGFLKLDDSNLKLYIFGSGELEEYIKTLNSDKIKYFGTLKNDDILKYEQDAMLLINPRYSNEEYTKYSFPSKNMEYMSSGTPVLTTKLPGIPEEYNEFVYFIENENVLGIKRILETLISKPINELKEFGEKAKEFVLKNKNKKTQANKIIKMTSKTEEIRKKKMNSIYGIFLLFITILLSRNTLISSNVIGFYNSIFVTILCYIPLIYNFFRKKMYKNISISIVLLIVLIILSILLKQDFQFYNLSIILYIILSLIYVKSYYINDILKWFCWIIFFLTFYSLISTYILYPIISGQVINIKNSVLYFENVEKIPFFNMIFSFSVVLPNYIRNFGIFTEPGFYQFYIILAILIMLFSNVFKNNIYKYLFLIIYVVTIISTFSTAAYIYCSLLIGYLIFKLFNKYKKKKTKKEIIIVITILIISLLTLVLYVMYFRNAFTDTLYAASMKIFSINPSSLTRFNSLIYTTKLAFSSLFLGNDLGNVIDNLVIITNTNVTFTAIYGFFAGLLLIILQYRLCRKISKREIIISLLIILLSVNNHLFIGVNSFWLLMLLGLEDD